MELNWNNIYDGTITAYAYLIAFILSYYAGKLISFIFKKWGRGKLEKVIIYLLGIIIAWICSCFIDLNNDNREINYDKVLKYFFIITPALLLGVAQEIKDARNKNID